MESVVNFRLLIIGDEILSGRRQDKHLAKVIELLAGRGLRLSAASLIGDDRSRLVSTLRQSFASGDIVFSFGGIGATPDDHTRQSAALAAEKPLILHPDAEREIRIRFGAETTDLRLEMGRYPLGSEIIPNPYNRIPGFSYAEHHFLPGFPEMAWPMMEWVLDHKYRHLHHAHAWAEESIAVIEAHESKIVDIMERLESVYGVTVFSLPHLGSEALRAHIELGAKGAPEAVASAMAEMRAELSKRGQAWSEVVDLHAN